jgi:hypothetical protein
MPYLVGSEGPPVLGYANGLIFSDPDPDPDPDSCGGLDCSTYWAGQKFCAEAGYSKVICDGYW